MAINVPFTQLELPADTVRRVAGRLHTSPLYDLVRQHVRSLCSDAARLADEPGAAEVGQPPSNLSAA